MDANDPVLAAFFSDFMNEGPLASMHHLGNPGVAVVGAHGRGGDAAAVQPAGRRADRGLVLEITLLVAAAGAPGRVPAIIGTVVFISPTRGVSSIAAFRAAAAAGVTSD